MTLSPTLSTRCSTRVWSSTPTSPSPWPGVELLGIKIRAALASFETAAKYGLEFPAGTTLQTPGRAIMPAEARGRDYAETFAQQLDAQQLDAEAPAHVPAR